MLLLTEMPAVIGPEDNHCVVAKLPGVECVTVARSDDRQTLYMPDTL